MSLPTLHVSAAFESPKPVRRTSRHQVELPCEVIHARADDPLLLWATDMSASGLWIETDQVLDLGAELVVCLQPGVRWRAREITVFGRVARVSPGLRGADDSPGVGVDFLDLTRAEHWNLRRWLRPRPQPRARRRSFGRPRPRQRPPSDHPFASRLG